MKTRRTKKKSKRKFTTVSIPTSLFRAVEERIKDTGFVSVSSYVTYVLREIVSRERESDSEPFTEEDKKQVLNRMKALGYL